MAMDRVTLRLPHSVIAAYEAADGNRSAVMRRRLTDAVENGELEGVPDDLQTLATVESIVEGGNLTRRRATFKSRCHGFFADKWDEGGVTGDDADALAEAWRKEAAVFGEEEIAYVEAVVEWFEANYQPDQKPEFPDADAFVARADPERDDVSVPDRLIDVAREGLSDGLSREAMIQRLSRFHPDERARQAVESADSKP
jgi:hypothetical protein